MEGNGGIRQCWTLGGILGGTRQERTGKDREGQDRTGQERKGEEEVRNAIPYHTIPHTHTIAIGQVLGSFFLFPPNTTKYLYTLFSSSPSSSSFCFCFLFFLFSLVMRCPLVFPSLGKGRLIGPFTAGRIRHGTTWHGMVWYGMVWHRMTTSLS